MTIVLIFLSTLIVSAISFVGILTLAFKGAILEKIVFCLIGFSAGALIGGAFLHILPEVLDKAPAETVFYYIIIGIVIFFLLERFLYWRHCHEGVCDVHVFTYLNLIGDGLHNFIDGLAIAVSFVVSIKLGFVTTLVVILHEIPQELGDFGVLIYGGFSKRRALFFNFLSALMAVVGAMAGYFISDVSSGFSNLILPLTAGGFIYIAASDLIPEMHKETDTRRSTLCIISFLLGIIFMAAFKIFLPEA